MLKLVRQNSFILNHLNVHPLRVIHNNLLGPFETFKFYLLIDNEFDELFGIHFKIKIHITYWL